MVLRCRANCVQWSLSVHVRTSLQQQQQQQQLDERNNAAAAVLRYIVSRNRRLAAVGVAQADRRQWLSLLSDMISDDWLTTVPARLCTTGWPASADYCDHTITSQHSLFTAPNTRTPRDLRHFLSSSDLLHDDRSDTSNSRTCSRLVLVARFVVGRPPAICLCWPKFRK